MKTLKLLVVIYIIQTRMIESEYYKHYIFTTNPKIYLN